jgi:hypothetical protein
MCGIAGAIGPNAEPLVRAMTAALVHRGPDDDGFHLDAGLALGFRRLSIIDVSGGHQPIGNETGDLVADLQRRDLQQPGPADRLDRPRTRLQAATPTSR